MTAVQEDKSRYRQYPECDNWQNINKGRRITLYLNGDRNFFGAQMLVNRRQTRSWEAFLNASTQKTGVTTAVRCITTPETGTEIGDLEDLQDKQSYVAITRGKFKPIGYTTLCDRYKQYSARNIHSTSSILKIRPVEHSHIQVPSKIAGIPIHSIMINVYANGKSFDAPFRISLNARVMRKWDLVLKEIGERIKDIVPKTLYTVDGSRIISRSADLKPGGEYVIVGNEPGGFKHYCYGYYHKLKNPKKLPPIKPRRIHRKKPKQQGRASIGQCAPTNMDKPPEGAVTQPETTEPLTEVNLTVQDTHSEKLEANEAKKARIHALLIPILLKSMTCRSVKSASAAPNKEPMPRRPVKSATVPSKRQPMSHRQVNSARYATNKETDAKKTLTGEEKEKPTAKKHDDEGKDWLTNQKDKEELKEKATIAEKHEIEDRDWLTNEKEQDEWKLKPTTAEKDEDENRDWLTNEKEMLPNVWITKTSTRERVLAATKEREKVGKTEEMSENEIKDAESETSTDNINNIAPIDLPSGIYSLWDLRNSKEQEQLPVSDLRHSENETRELPEDLTTLENNDNYLRCGDENLPLDEKDTNQEERDKPENVKDTPPDKEDTPQDVKDTPPDEEDTPPNEKNTDQDERETPQDVKDTPQDEEDTPQDVKDTPQDEEDTPPDEKDTNQNEEEQVHQEFYPELDEKDQSHIQKSSVPVAGITITSNTCFARKYSPCISKSTSEPAVYRPCSKNKDISSRIERDPSPMVAESPDLELVKNNERMPSGTYISTKSGKTLAVMPPCSEAKPERDSSHTELDNAKRM